MKMLYWLLVVGFIVAVADLAVARPPHKKAMAKHFGPFLSKKLNSCQTCHLPDQPKQEGKPHNAFGKRLVALKNKLRDEKKSYDIPARLTACANEDSDGDGASNLIELLTGHFPGDANDRPAATALKSASKTLLAFRTHLARYQWRPYRLVSRPSLPSVKNNEWVRNPIDAFLARQHEEHGLQPRPPAAKHILLRRVYLDLIGLPPSPAEMQAFLEDGSPDAYERVVEELLADPRHGERWARHWMDVWRYSDWAGYRAEVRDSKPHIWRWRDWIVDALNADKGYDRMIQEMLAGDELEPENPEVVRATGFLVRNWYKFNRNVWLDRIIEHTAKGMLGVTLNCARCHDHKYDPISHEEYYQFRAIFEPHQIRTDRVPGEFDVNKTGLVRVYDADANAKTFLFIAGNENQPDKKNPLSPSVLSALNWREWNSAPVGIPLLGRTPDKRDFVIRDLLASKERLIATAKSALAKAKKNPQAETVIALAELDVEIAQSDRDVLQAVVNVEKLEDAGKTDGAWQVAAKAAFQRQRTLAFLKAKRNALAAEHAWTKANAKTKPAAKKNLDQMNAALVMAKKTLDAPLTTNYTKRTVRSYPATSTGRRLALARWIADPKNPRTARVAINHIWLRHFGQPLVPTVFDFGNNGKPPTHPALLDWLAVEMMDNGWSHKHVHRLIVTSNAYRMDSTNDAAIFAKDPDNQHLWRMKPKRMEAEIVRDSVLYTAGKLEQQMGGAELDEKLGMTTYRRSLYYRHAPEKMMEFLTMFDSANVVECYRRSETVVPQQALALANSTLVTAHARMLARSLMQKLEKEATASDFVRMGFERILCRPPTVAELDLCEKFLTKQTAMFRDGKKLTKYVGGPSNTVPPSPDPEMRAQENLIHVLFNHNEFVTIR